MSHNYLLKSLVSLGLSLAFPLVNEAADKAPRAPDFCSPTRLMIFFAVAAWPEEHIEKMS